MKSRVFFIILFSFLAISCGEKKVQSKWADFEIAIDGNIEDWEGKLLYFKDEQAALGIANDSLYLYVALSTRERSDFVQALTGGLILWFENENADSKTIGINFPIGNKMDFSSERMHPNKENNTNEMIKTIIESQNELSIIDDDSYPLALLSVKNNKNIEAAIGLKKNVFYYELKIPLKKSKTTPYAIGANINDNISLTIESVEPKKNGRNSDHSGMRVGSMGGGMSGGKRGGGRVGPGGAMNATQTEPIDISLNIKLALPDSSQN